MADVRERIEAEFENVTRVLGELPANVSQRELSVLELAGTAALLHSFYNGVENVLKHLVRARGLHVSSGASWHRDLVNVAVAAGIISESTASDLKRYMAFRHFFSHGYAFDLNQERILPLTNDAGDVFRRFRSEVEDSLKE